MRTSKFLTNASPGIARVAAWRAPRGEPYARGLRQSIQGLLEKVGAYFASLSGALHNVIWLLLALSLANTATARELDFAKVGQETLNLNAYASWAEDRSGALTFDLARSDKGPLTFKEIPGGAWNADFDRSSSAYWVKLPIINSGNAPAGRLLVMAQPLLEHIEVFCEAPDGSLRGTKTGHGMAFDSRPYPHRLLIIPFLLAPRESQTVWIRVKSPFSADLSAQLWDTATFQTAEHADAMRYGWIGGLCAALALVFAFLWAATGQKAFAWFLGTVLAATWRIGENSGLLPVLLPWSGHTLATVSHLLADAALLFFTVGLLLHALGKRAADLPYRRALYAAGGLSLVLPVLTPWPMLAAAVLHSGVPLAYGVLVLLSAWLAVRGARVFLWYCMGLVVPLVSLYLQHLPQSAWVGNVLFSSYSMDNALVQGLVVLAGAVAFQEVQKRQVHMRELRGLLQEQNQALEKARQAEIDLESQVSQRTQELAMAARRLEALSTVDGMTGVANRRRFDETLQVEWGRAARDKRPLSVALIDVDWFKTYNDRYGHPAGDACLRQLARVFEAGVMRSGDLIARYGGEEFVLIAPDTDLNGINTIASYLCQEVFALALAHEDSPYGRVSVSIGVATAYPHQGSKPLQLVQQADAALYRAKQQGRHRVAGPEVEKEKA